MSAQPSAVSTVFQGSDLACIRGERLLFEGLGFSVAAGDALVLRGPNGAGKTSLLRLMAGLLKPAAGALSWGGEAIGADREAHRARITYIGHLDAIKAPLTAAENLAFWARFVAGRAASDAPPTAALERFGLGGLGDIPARLLSAGQRRRLSLARLLAAPTPLWLLDEPATSLDADGVGVLNAVLADHLAGGGLIVAASHSDLMGGTAATLRLGGAAQVTPP